MNDALVLALGVALGAGVQYVANRLSTKALCDMNAMLAAALHPAAPLPPSIERDEHSDTGEVVDHGAIRAARIAAIRSNLERAAGIRGETITDEALSAEAERLAGADIHRGA